MWVHLQVKVGDSVYLSSEHIILKFKADGACKLLHRWLGPSDVQVLEKVTTVNYTFDIPAHYRILPTFMLVCYALPTILAAVKADLLSS